MGNHRNDRRRFVAGMGLLALQLALPGGRASAATASRTTLSLPLSQLRESYDVIVIGSGYGGAVMAARLAPGRRLAVLERGREWQPAEFPSSAAGVLGQFRGSNRPLGLFDYRTGSTLDVLSGSGLGGTSLINANVVIAPDRDVFERWPAAIRAAYADGSMTAYEARVQAMLGAETIVEADALRKHGFHRSTTLARQRQGRAVVARPLPLAVNLRRYNQQPNAQGVVQSLCSHCGDCVSGCRVGAKNTLDVNYLPLARQAGAEIYTRIEVDWLERLSDGRWRLHYTARPDGQPARSGQLLARDVIVAAGALGSTQLLLRSRANGLALSTALGTRFSANGDLLGFAYNGDVRTDAQGYGAVAPSPRGVGPTITLAADYRGTAAVANRFLIEEGAIPSAVVDALRLAFPPLAGTATDVPAAQRVARDLLGRSSDGALNHSMAYLGIGHDSASGRVELDAQGNARAVWPGLPQEPFVARLRSEMAAHAAQFGGRHLDSPRTHALFGGALTTVHPLGGCPMSDTAQNGVVDADGRVYDGRGAQSVHAGLRVVDGSIAPASLGVNPLLTIAALAERCAERYGA